MTAGDRPVAVTGRRTMGDLVELWIQGEGRISDPVLVPQPHQRVCWRCGADWRGAPLSGCTEKRGTAQPWRHEYRTPGFDHPWAGYDLVELASLASYFRLKAAGSLSAVKAWEAVMKTSPSAAIAYAIRLYTEKADKRTRLYGWVLQELELSAREEVADGHPERP